MFSMCVGYLKEEGCNASYKVFLKEMKHLEEYRLLLQTGYEYPTSICGKSLKMMLNDYGYVVLNGNYCSFYHHHQQINTQLFTCWMPFLLPIQQC